MPPSRTVPPHRAAERALRAARTGSEEERTRAGIRLAEVAKAGDPHAVAAVVALHRDRVRAVASRLRVPRDDADHYASIGLEALLSRLPRYEPARGVPLWGYARLHVWGAMILALGASLGLTAHQSSAYRRVWRAYDDAAGDDPDYRTPSAKEVHQRVRDAYGAGIGLPTVAAVLSARERRPVALDDLSPTRRARALRSS